jgi:hypothetical protein
MKDEDGQDLPDGDFRRLRRYLAPWLFASESDDRDVRYPPPTDLVPEDAWDHIMILPTDVALKSSSYEGTAISRLSQLHTDWIFSWPDVGDAPFVEEAALLAGEEFDALVFNALHGWYRQALGCLRNALETMTIASAFSVRNEEARFRRWRAGTLEVKFGNARDWLRDSRSGQQVDADAAPGSVFGQGATAWVNDRYARLCAYAHSQAGYNNADFWESNGPIFVPSTLNVVESEFRETLALCYLLLRLGWPNYKIGQGQPALLNGPLGMWATYGALLRKWIL